MAPSDRSSRVLSGPDHVRSRDELGMTRGDVEDDLRHAIRTARAQGRAIDVVPARCKACDFVFAPEKLLKPSRCPACKGTRLYEPMIRFAGEPGR